MSHRLNTKQYVPLSDDERQALRNEAATRGISAGLLARALLLYGFDKLDDAAVDARITEEKIATKERITQGARIAVNARWATTTEGTETP